MTVEFKVADPRRRQAPRRSHRIWNREPGVSSLYPKASHHRFFFFFLLLVALRRLPEPKPGSPPPARPPIMPASPPEVIIRIIFRISVYSLIIWFTSWTAVPLPRAMRLRRDPFSSV